MSYPFHSAFAREAEGHENKRWKKEKGKHIDRRWLLYWECEWDVAIASSSTPWIWSACALLKLWPPTGFSRAWTLRNSKTLHKISHSFAKTDLESLPGWSEALQLHFPETLGLAFARHRGRINLDSQWKHFLCRPLCRLPGVPGLGPSSWVSGFSQIDLEIGVPSSPKRKTRR